MARANRMPRLAGRMRWKLASLAARLPCVAPASAHGAAVSHARPLRSAERFTDRRDDR